MPYFTLKEGDDFLPLHPARTTLRYRLVCWLLLASFLSSSVLPSSLLSSLAWAAPGDDRHDQHDQHDQQVSVSLEDRVTAEESSLLAGAADASLVREQDGDLEKRPIDAFFISGVTDADAFSRRLIQSLKAFGKVPESVIIHWVGPDRLPPPEVEAVVTLLYLEFPSLRGDYTDSETGKAVPRISAVQVDAQDYVGMVNTATQEQEQTFVARMDFIRRSEHRLPEAARLAALQKEEGVDERGRPLERDVVRRRFAEARRALFPVWLKHRLRVPNGFHTLRYFRKPVPLKDRLKDTAFALVNTVLVLSVAGKTLHDNPRLDMSRYIVATAAFSLFWAFFQGASIDRKSQGVVYNYETNRVEVSALSVGWIAYLDSVFTRGMVAAVALGPKFAVWDIVTTLMVSLRSSFTKIFFERWIGELKMKNPTWGDVANRVFSTTMNVLAPLDQFKAALMLNFAFLHLSVGLGTAVRAVLTTVGTLGLARLLFFTKRQSTVTGLARAGRWARRTLLGGPDPREGCDALLKVRFRDAQGADGAVGDQSALAVKP